jgi:hypothetical protein
MTCHLQEVAENLAVYEFGNRIQVSGLNVGDERLNNSDDHTQFVEVVSLSCEDFLNLSAVR